MRGQRDRGYFGSLLLATALLAGAADAEPPDDPYRWLEEIDGERALAWVRAQNEATAKRLQSRPEFESLHEQALAVLNGASRIPYELEQRGGYVYELWRDDANPRGLYRRATLEELRRATPRWEVVLDLDALSAAEGQVWVFKSMACLPEAYRHCLVFLSPGGGDAVVMREFDMAEKVFVAEGFRLPRAKMLVDWRDKDTLYVGTDFGEGSITESGYPRLVKLWRRGTPLSEARTLYEGRADTVGSFARRLRSAGGDIDLVEEALTFWRSLYYQVADGRLERLSLPETAVVEDAFAGRLLISLKEDWSSAGRTLKRGAVVIAWPETLRGGKGEIEVLVEPDERSVVEDVEGTPGGILVSMLENVRSRLYRYRPKTAGGWWRSAVAFPDDGSLTVTGADEDGGSFFARYESFTSPPTLYHVDALKDQPEKIKAQAATFDGSRFRVEQLFATSVDGTRVPYWVVSAKNTPLDGKNPTHLFAYGGFRIALTPSYSGTSERLYGAYGKLWLERGGVFVLANIRGGGEFGPDWHAAALLDNRHKAFEDFEAVAEDLVRRRITSPEHLGIEGRSNGGLLVGAAFTRRPELYGAVVCGVPLADMKRYHELLAGASWMAEYGDPDDPEMWDYIKTYSPYHNLHKGRAYPPVFFFTSTRDDRVHPGHARKMAAKMIELGYEVDYFENIEGGHGGSSTNEQLARRLALAYTHLWSRLGEARVP